MWPPRASSSARRRQIHLYNTTSNACPPGHRSSFHLHHIATACAFFSISNRHTSTRGPIPILDVCWPKSLPNTCLSVVFAFCPLLRIFKFSPPSTVPNSFTDHRLFPCPSTRRRRQCGLGTMMLLPYVRTDVPSGRRSTRKTIRYVKNKPANVVELSTLVPLSCA